VLLFQPLEADALLRRGLLAEIVEDLLDVGDMLLRLLQVLLEPLLELGILHLPDQLGQYLVGELLLDVEDVTQLVDEEVAWRCDLWHWRIPSHFVDVGLRK
jgi:hypothetical protein